MDDFNKKQYEEYHQQYLESNTDGSIGGGNPSTRIELLKKYLPTGRSVFEIGSGGGEDALALKKAGYNITASDYVINFVTILQQKGLNAVYFDAKSDIIPETDAIYANAVFVHFTEDEISDFLKRNKKSLSNEKIMFLSVIKGTGSERSARSRGFERDFYYHSVEAIRLLLEQEGYHILYSNNSDPKWIQLVASL